MSKQEVSTNKATSMVRIKSIDKTDVGYIVNGLNPKIAFPVSSDYMQKHNPQAGGCYISYNDGYESYLSSNPFEDSEQVMDAATETQQAKTETQALVTFGQATEAAMAGKKVARIGWNGQGMFAYIVPAASYPAQTGAAKDHFGENALVPYRAYWALKTAQNDIATWAPSGSDSLAKDWIVID